MNTPNIKNIILNNPIEYLFQQDYETVLKIIESMVDKEEFSEDWSVVKYGNDDVLILYIYVLESPYHTLLGKPIGRENSSGGRMQGKFLIKVLNKNGKTLVNLEKLYYKILIGEKYEWLSPDPGYVAAFKSIPSSTYFEYSFLLKLGELLGEKGMPQINDNPDGIRTKFYEEKKRKKAEEEAKRLEQKSRPVYYKEEEKESIEDGKFYNKKYQDYDFKEK